jgi:hypothetical protein
MFFSTAPLPARTSPLANHCPRRHRARKLRGKKIAGIFLPSNLLARTSPLVFATLDALHLQPRGSRTEEHSTIIHLQYASPTRRPSACIPPPSGTAILQKHFDRFAVVFSRSGWTPPRLKEEKAKGPKIKGNGSRAA